MGADMQAVTPANEVRTKPPLGLRPRWIANSQRAEEIVAAITRYNEASTPVPQTWRDELDELNTWLESEGYAVRAGAETAALINGLTEVRARQEGSKIEG